MRRGGERAGAGHGHGDGDGRGRCRGGCSCLQDIIWVWARRFGVDGGVGYILLLIDLL